MRRVCLALAGAALLILQTGCWNSKDIQNMAYVTAIGFDYKDGKYVTYVQVLNFSNVAKGDIVEVGKRIPAWIGQGEGKTVTESFNSIYATSQLRIFWGHVKAIVLSDRFVRNGERLKEAYDMVNRYREIRYNILIYGTREEMREVFAQKSMLNMSPLDTLLDTPDQAYSQRSFLLPVYGFKLIAQFNEPAGAAMLPSLTLERRAWTEDEEKRTMFRIDGAYFFRGQDCTGWLSEQSLAGYRWLQKELERSPVNIPDDGAPDAAIVLMKPKPRIRHFVRDGNIYYNVSLSLHAFVDELVHPITKKEIERQAARVVEKQIRATYKTGLGIKADVLNLDECLFRDNPKLWHEAHRQSDFILKEDSLEGIKVKVNLIHSGKYRLRVN